MPLETRRPGICRLAIAAILAVLPGHAVSQNGLPAEATAFAPATVMTTPTPLSGNIAGTEQMEAERALKDQELAKLRGAMELSAEKQAEIAAEIAGLSRDQQALSDQLVTSAARVQTLEQSITDSEERLARGADNEARIRVSLAARRDRRGAPAPDAAHRQEEGR